MSQHLLPVKTGNEQIPVEYRNIHSINPGCCCCVEHDSMLYCLIQDYNGSAASSVGAWIYRINLFTGESTLYATFTRAQLTMNIFIGQMLVDDENIYLTSTNSLTVILTFKLRDSNVFDPTTPLEFVRSSAPGSWNVYNAATGKMKWFDKDTICMPYAYGLMFYLVKSGVWYRKSQSDTYGIKDFAIGEKLIVMTNSTSGATDSVIAYRVEYDTFFKFSLPSTNPACVCYDPDRKRFYFANTNYLYIYDETTETLIDTKNIPWSNPFSIEYSDGNVYVLCYDSNKLFMHDVTSSDYISFFAQWSFPSNNYYKQPTYPCAVDGFWFVLRNTLCIVDYTGYSKYNFGYKYESISILANKRTQNEFTFDPRFVTFDETFMSIHDGNIAYELTPDETDSRFKIATIHKSDYKFINRTELN